MVKSLLDELFARERGIVWSTGPDTLVADAPDKFAGVLSGSFNPLHEGHRALKRAAEAHLRRPVCYELPVVNADKPPVDPASLLARRAQFGTEPLALTAAPTFAGKAVLIPGAAFVIGVDTAARVIEPRFYGHSEQRMYEALNSIRKHGCRFLVAGRLLENRFTTLADLVLPHRFEDLFEALPESAFRKDVSSTELRAARDPGRLG